MTEAHKPRGASTQEAAPPSTKETKQQRLERNVTAIVERIFIDFKIAGTEAEKEITQGLEGMSAAKKALRIYEILFAYGSEKRGTDKDAHVVPPDPYLVSELSLLWESSEARRLFLEKYTTARLDTKEFSISELGKKWHEIEKDISDLQEQCAKLKQALTLRTITRPTEVSATHAMLRYKRHVLDQLQQDRENIIMLKNGRERTQDNCDGAALIEYEQLMRYRREVQEKQFAKLPSRVNIQREIQDVMEHTGKAPLLIGPPGTGKTTQINAAAIESTGEPAISIGCESGFGEEGLLLVRDVRAGEGAYEYRGRIAEAFTGYQHSQDTKPACSHGRWASLDEISELSMEKALATLKNVLLAEPGKPLSALVDRPVLPGSALVATSNSPIADERLDREFARIPVSYFEMTAENPELFEFMISMLLAGAGHLTSIGKEALAPMYEKKPVSPDEQKPLADGRIIIAIDELVPNPADPRHGFLYRFAHAIVAIQDSYIHGSKFNEKKLAHTAFYEDIAPDTGKIFINGYIPNLQTVDTTTSPGGEMLKLHQGASTIAPKIIRKWIEGFASRGESDIVTWLRRMLKKHINQTSREDGERIHLIADYFHLFDNAMPAHAAEPLTPKEIGYLSPRVPRPVYTKEPDPGHGSDEGRKGVDVDTTGMLPVDKPVVSEYGTKKVLLEDSTEVLIRGSDLPLGSGDDVVFVRVGEELLIDNQAFVFAGVVEDKESPNDTMPLCHGANSDIYRIISVETLQSGILLFNAQKELDAFSLLEKDANDFLGL